MGSPESTAPPISGWARMSPSWSRAEPVVESTWMLRGRARSWPAASHGNGKSQRLPSRRFSRRRVRPTGTSESLNQSRMELGALICAPRTPNCAACPVQTICIARKENLQEQLPNLGKRPAATKRRFIAFVVKQNGKFLVRQRPAGVVNAHLWEFPNVEVGARVCDPQQIATDEAPRSNGSANSTKALRLTEPRSAAKELSLKLTSTKPLVVIKHSITRYRITLEAWRAELANPPGAPVSDPARSKTTTRNPLGRRPALRGRWLARAELKQLAFTSAHKKILDHLPKFVSGGTPPRPLPGGEQRPEAHAK